MDNIEKNDPEFRNKAGAQSATTIGRFQKLCKRSRRFCRKSKYYVIFDLLEALTQVGADGMVMGGDFRKFCNEANMQRRSTSVCTSS